MNTPTNPPINEAMEKLKQAIEELRKTIQNV